MNVGTLPPDRFGRQLRDQGVAVRAGAIVTRIRSSLPEVAASLQFLYADFPLEPDGIVDFHVWVRPVARRLPWRGARAEFIFDGGSPFPPFPRGMALAMLEWGLNWCIYHHAHTFLILHAAVVERGGRALLLPGPPGSGKSTLCAGLVMRGWRLLSDELTLLRPSDGKVVPIARAISLKDGSIEAVRALGGGAVAFGPEFSDARQRTLTHMRPPAESVRRAGEAAVVSWIVFPAFSAQANAQSALAPVRKASAFCRLNEQSLNYHVLGPAAFQALTRLTDDCSSHELSYSSLEGAVRVLADLA